MVCLVVWDARCWAVDCRNLTWQPQRRTSAHWLPSLAGGKGSRTGAHPVVRLLTGHMPRLTPKKASASRAAKKAGDVHAVSTEERAIQAAMPPLVKQGPSSQQAAVQRPNKPRRAKEVANCAWLKAREAFNELPLVDKRRRSMKSNLGVHDRAHVIPAW